MTNSSLFIKNVSRAWLCAFVAVILSLRAATGSFAAQSGTAGEVPQTTPIIIYTLDPAALVAGGPGDQLLQRTREKGWIRVIVGLRTVMRMEHTLMPQQVETQRQGLRNMQDTIISRVLGSASAPGADRFTFIPYMALFVDETQLGRLLNDPDVVSIQEVVTYSPALDKSIPLVHADDVFAKGFNGTGRVVAVLDTGVAKKHPMLAGKVVSEACYSTDFRPLGFVSLCPGGVTESTAAGSGVNCPLSVSGCNHGTHVASIAAGNSATLDGVARDARIIAIQVFTRLNDAADCGNDPAPCIRTSDPDLIKGLERVYALRDTYKIAATNMSIAGGLFAGTCDATNQHLTTAIANIRDVGIAPVVASGNDGSTTKIGSPACISKAIAVGNTTNTDLVYRTSNHSRLVKLLAPGTGINAAVPGGKYDVMTGTSMAAPHVSGAFALLKSAKPGVTVNKILEALTCTGKVVSQRSTVGGPVDITSPRPRIDLLGAFNYLLKPPDALRTWNFTDPAEAKDWTPLLGKWTAGNGTYRAALTMGQGFFSSVADCSGDVEVEVRMRRVQPEYSYAPGGIVIKSEVDYTWNTVSGYVFFWTKARDNGLYYSLQVHRMNNWNLIYDYADEDEMLCGEVFKSNFNDNGYNTFKAVSRGASHSFYFNGQEVCTINDSWYVAGGPVLVYTGEGAAGDSYFSVDYVKIKSLEGVAAMEPDGESIMDPAAYAPGAGRGGAPEGRQ